MRKTRIKVVVVDGVTMYLPQVKEWGIYWRTFNRDDAAVFEVYQKDQEAQWSDYYEGKGLNRREDIFYHESYAKDVLSTYREGCEKKLKEARIRKVLGSKYFR